MNLATRLPVILALAALPALAQTKPATLAPTRDVTVTYALQAPGGPPGGTMRMMIAAGGGRMRVEMPGGMGYGVMDAGAGSVTMVMTPMNMVVEMPMDAAMRRMVMQPDAQYQRVGTRTVAGLSCTDWRVVVPQQAPATACLTEDGVLLRAEGRSPDGSTGSMEATEVRFAPIPPAMFVVPANLPRMQLPPGFAEMMQRMGQGGGPGGMPGGMPGMPGGMPGMPGPPPAR